MNSLCDFSSGHESPLITASWRVPAQAASLLLSRQKCVGCSACSCIHKSPSSHYFEVAMRYFYSVLFNLVFLPECVVLGEGFFCFFLVGFVLVCTFLFVFVFCFF